MEYHNISIERNGKKLKKFLEKKGFNVKLEKCAAVGNSCFDVPMFETCGVGIAFNPGDECVRKLADLIVEGKDLGKLIPVFHK